MLGTTLLTTAEVAELASVAPSTIKRWADQGVLPTVRTAGGHRRFERHAVARLLGPALDADAGASGWIACLVRGQRHELDSRLLEARSRLGSWFAVADELMVPLAEMGRRWRAGLLQIADEHVASEALERALSRIGDALPTRTVGPVALLACAPEDDHTIGLSLAEVCLRELGWKTRWTGRRTPGSEIVRIVRSDEVQLVVLVASAASRAKGLVTVAGDVSRACAEHDVALVLGGAGAWPSSPRHGVRLTTFAQLHDEVRGVAG